MSNVTNLNQFRKAKSRQNKRKIADENAVRFGRTKAEKSALKTQLDKAKRDHDGHKT